MAEIEKRPKNFSDTAKDIVRRIFRHESAALAIVLIAVIAALSVITKGLTSRPANVSNLLLLSSIKGVAAVGQAFVILTAGIDLSLGGIGLFSGVLGASMMTGLGYQQLIPGWTATLPLGILAMLLAATGVGSINGLSVSRLGMPPLMVTLAMWKIMEGAAFLTCKGHSIGHLPEAMAYLGSGNVAGVPVPVIIFIGVAVVAYFVLNHTTFGRGVYAVGGNPVSTWLSGINVKNTLFMVYVIAGFLAGLASVMMVGRVMAGSMRTLAGLELNSIASVVVGGVSLAGGRGSLIGVILGILIMGVAENAMSVLGASPALQGIATGAIIFTAVAIDFLRRR